MARYEWTASMTENARINGSAGTGYDELDRGWGGLNIHIGAIETGLRPAAAAGCRRSLLSVTRCHNIATPTRRPPTLYQINY